MRRTLHHRPDPHRRQAILRDLYILPLGGYELVLDVIGCAPWAHPLGLRVALHVDLVERPPHYLVCPRRTR
jgi:hypothetical protein